MAIKNWSGTYSGLQTMLVSDENHIVGDVQFDDGLIIEPGQTIYTDGVYNWRIYKIFKAEATRNTVITLTAQKAQAVVIAGDWGHVYPVSMDIGQFHLQWVKQQGSTHALFTIPAEDALIEDCWFLANTYVMYPENTQFYWGTFKRCTWKGGLHTFNLKKSAYFYNCRFEFMQGFSHGRNNNLPGGQPYNEGYYYDCLFKDCWSAAITQMSSEYSNRKFHHIRCIFGKFLRTGSHAYDEGMNHGRWNHYRVFKSSNNDVRWEKCILACGFSYGAAAIGVNHDAAYHCQDCDIINVIGVKYKYGENAYCFTFDNCFVADLYNRVGYQLESGNDLNIFPFYYVESVSNPRSIPNLPLTFSNELSNVVGGVCTFTCNSNSPADVEVEFGKTTDYGMTTGFVDFRDGDTLPGTSLKMDGHSIALDISKLMPGTYHWRFKGYQDGTDRIFFGQDHTFVVEEVVSEIPVITTSNQEVQQKYLNIGGTCQTENVVIKIYIDDVYTGQSVYSPSGETDWTVENVEMNLGANIVKATAKAENGIESNKSTSITITGVIPDVPVITTPPQSAATNIDIAGTCQSEECYLRVYIGGVDTDQGLLKSSGNTTFVVEGVKVGIGVNSIAISAENDFGESNLSSPVIITGTGVLSFEGIPTLKLKVGSKVLQEKDLMPGFEVVKFDLTKGDDAVLRLNLLDLEGAPLDLSTATSVNLKVKQSIYGSTYIINQAMTIEAAVEGKVYYVIGKTVFTSPGVFIGEISITWDTGRIATAERRIEINVKPEL